MVTFSALSVHKLFVDGGAASMQCIVAWPIVTCQILGSVQGLVRVCGQVTSPNSHGGSLRTCSALTDCSWDTSFCKPGPVLNWPIVMGQTVIWIVFGGERWDGGYFEEEGIFIVEAKVRDRPPCCTHDDSDGDEVVDGVCHFATSWECGKHLASLRSHSGLCVHRTLTTRLP